MEEEYKYGDPIPEKYRNRLYDWKGGGYDGCFWEMNQGFVDKDGHWRPIFSTGYDGIDQNEWYKNKIGALKADLGYSSDLYVSTQHERAQARAIEQVFGKEWYKVEGAGPEDPRVKKIMEEEDKRYDEFIRQRDAYRLEKTHRLDQLFMDVVAGSMKRDDFNEIGMIDADHIKETCRIFCESYKHNVGMMSNCLDALMKSGYDVWCTCSDCGEQFQLMDYDSFGTMVDGNAYHGDGGIGVIMTRILCEECHDEAECRVCNELDRPNRYAKDGGASDWSNYDFLACVLNAWLDVCWGCANGYELEHLYKWIESERHRIRTPLGEEYEKIEEAIKKEYGLDGHELYEELVKTINGRKKINAIRDLLSETAVEHFHSSLDDDWFMDRLDTDSPGQMKIPGIGE